MENEKSSGGESAHDQLAVLVQKGLQRPRTLLSCAASWEGGRRMPADDSVGYNGLKFLRLRRGGHNNTENNPVFRGMVRPKGGLLTKGKL